MKAGQHLISVMMLIVFPYLVGCTPADNFAGGGGRQGIEDKPALKPPVNQNPQPTTPPTEECTQSKLISVRSVKTRIDQRGLDRSLPIELNFQPCPTQKSNLQLPVKFDLDADMLFSSLGPSIPYQLMINGAAASSGFLQSVQGSDLFDKAGPQYVHFLSSNPLTVLPGLTAATLVLDLRNIQLMGPTNSSAPATTDFSVASHIRVGDPAPVTGQITFTPAY